MISLLGTIFSGISLYWQYLEKKEEDKAIKILFESLKTTSKHLELVKSIHRIYQSLFYDLFESIANDPMKLRPNEMIQEWNIFYTKFLNSWESSNFDVLIKKNDVKECSNESYDSNVTKLDLENQTLIISTKHPKLYNDIFIHKELIEILNNKISNDQIDYNDLRSIKEKFTSILIGADTVMINFIEVLNRFISTLL